MKLIFTTGYSNSTSLINGEKDGQKTDQLRPRGWGLCQSLMSLLERVSKWYLNLLMNRHITISLNFDAVVHQDDKFDVGNILISAAI